MNVKFPIAGGVISATLWIALGFSWRVELAEWILAAAPLIFVPLALRRLPSAGEGIEKAATATIESIYWPSAWLFGGAFLLGDKGISFALTFPWMCVTVLGAVAGASRLGTRRDLGWPARLTGVAQGLMVVGSVATGLAILELQPFGFPVGIILLTGVHFHYAAFILPVLTMSLAENGGRRWLNWSAGLMVAEFVAIPMIAVGLIVAPWLEWCGVLLLAIAAGTVAVLQVLQVLQAAGELRTARSIAGMGLTVISSLSLLTAMGLAIVYAWSEFANAPLIGIDTMVRTHGLLNAFGFCGCGLVGLMVRGASSRERNESAEPDWQERILDHESAGQEPLPPIVDRPPVAV